MNYYFTVFDFGVFDIWAVNEGLTDMIKYLANEPSVGLFFVQQHTQNAVPNLLHIRVFFFFFFPFSVPAVSAEGFIYWVHVEFVCVLSFLFFLRDNLANYVAFTCRTKRQLENGNSQTLAVT